MTFKAIANIYFILDNFSEASGQNKNFGANNIIKINQIFNKRSFIIMVNSLPNKNIKKENKNNGVNNIIRNNNNWT